MYWKNLCASTFVLISVTLSMHSIAIVFFRFYLHTKDRREKINWSLDGRVKNYTYILLMDPVFLKMRLLDESDPYDCIDFLLLTSKLESNSKIVSNHFRTLLASSFSKRRKIFFGSLGFISIFGSRLLNYISSSLFVLLSISFIVLSESIISISLLSFF